MRTQMPGLMQERLTAKMGLWLNAASNGDERGAIRVDTTVYVLRVLGFEEDVLKEIIGSAAEEIGADSNDAVSRFVTSTATTNRRQNTNGSEPSKRTAKQSVSG